jgi:Golgi apparatus protein 1
LEVGPEWTTGDKDESVSGAGSGVLSYEYRVTCDAQYYGPGCGTLCRPRNDNFGHYTCSENGTRLCLDGWKGDYCTKRKYLLLGDYLYKMFSVDSL